MSERLPTWLKPKFKSELHDLAVTTIEKLWEFPVQCWISPTYGKGEMHFLWEKWVERIKGQSLAGVVVFPLALGDDRHHSVTFGGAYERLVELGLKSGATIPNHETATQLPSRLVLDYVSSRRIAETTLRNWCDWVQEMLSEDC